MTFIDWSDGEEMLGLLAEFIREARNECQKDIKRRKFLSKLLRDVRALCGQIESLSPEQATSRLRSIYRSMDQDFAGDPVSVHVRDCVEELERLRKHEDTRSQRLH